MPTVDDLLRLYSAAYLPAHAPTTQCQQRGLFRRIARDLGDVPLDCLTPARLRAWRDALRHTLKSGTVRQYLDSFSAVLTVAVDELEWLPANPLSRVRRPKASPARVRVLSAEERTRLLAACRSSRNRSLYVLVLLALSTGCRRGELFGLRWQDVDLAQGAMRLAHTKNGEPRAVPVPDYALEVLRPLAEGQPLTAWVLPRTAKKARFPYEHAWRWALKRAQIDDFHFHDLRHTFASYVAMSGGTLAEIGEVLGHKSPLMTRRYVHFTQSHTRALVENMARMFLDEEG